MISGIWEYEISIEREQSHTPSVVFRISLKLSSSSNANESSGITTVDTAKRNHKYSSAKQKHVVRSRGRARYHRVDLLLATAKVDPLGEIIPRVSMEMRRISRDSCCGD